MRSGTLVLLVAINAAVAVGVVAVGLTVATPPSAPSNETASASRAGPPEEELRREIRAAREDLGAQISQLGGALAEERTLRESLEKKLAEIEESGVAGTPGGEGDDAAQQREAARQMMRGFTNASRSMGRRILEQIANPTEESIRQAEDRVRRDAGRLARRLGLSDARREQVERALLEVDRRTRDRMKATIDAKGIDNVTYEDAKPLVDESFADRERAMETVLTPDEMTTFQEQEQQGRVMVDMGMRMAFPPASSGEEGR